MLQSHLLKTFPELHHIYCAVDTNESMENEYFLTQIHSNRVVFVPSEFSTGIQADGMITNKPHTLCIKTADCLPILMYDPVNQVIAALHAGWKGILSGIIPEAIAKLEKLHTHTKNLYACIGPHIQDCCYQISYKRAKLIRSCDLSADSVTMKNQKWYTNLGNIASKQLLNLGLNKFHIEVIDDCTCCNMAYISYRRDGLKTERMTHKISLHE